MAADRTPHPALLLPVLLSLALAACATNPVTGKSELAVISESQELALGAEAHAAILQEYGYYADPDLQAYVDAVGQPIAAASHRPELVYTFTVLDSDVVNAMATPGYVYITRGLLAVLDSEAELAAVLGHEIAHITARHAVQQMGDQLIGDILIGTALASASSAVQSTADLVKTAVISGYGRDNELQADALGAQYAADAGYAPESMQAVLGSLQRYEEHLHRVSEAEGGPSPGDHDLFGGLLDDWFATHPDTDERLRHARRAVPSDAGDVRTARAEYLEQIDGMRIGADAAEGVIAGDMFYYPPRALAVRMPPDWPAANLPQHLVMQEPDGGAEFRLGLISGLDWARACAHAGEQFGAPLREQTWGAHTVCAAAHGAGIEALLRLDANAALVFSAEQARGQTAAFEAMVHSVREMTSAERARIRNLALVVRTAQPGDRFADYVPATPRADAHTEDWLRLINGAGPGEEPVPGAQVKVLSLQ